MAKDRKSSSVGPGRVSRGFWRLLGASTGFRHDAITSSLRLTADAGRYPFLTGSAWGVLDSDGKIARLRILHGELRVLSVAVGDHGPRHRSEDTLRVETGYTLEVSLVSGAPHGMRIVQS